MHFLKNISKILNTNNAMKVLETKFIHTSSSNGKLSKKYIEIKIPVPWGKITGKWWGPLHKKPIVCIHGWQDNCNTFDGLINLLPDKSYLAIDYPGHGYSSQYPNGMFYYPTDFPIILRRIQKYFGWQQMSILAHSLAANLSCLYTSLFPNNVDFLIALDGIKPYSYEPGNFIDKMAKKIDWFLKYDAINSSGREPPCYTLEEISNKMYKGNRESIDLEKCEILYKRNVKESVYNPGKYHFTRDVRLKSDSIIGFQHEDIKEYIKRVKCPMIVIRTTKSKFVEKEHYLNDAVEIMKQHNQNFHYVEFPGKHHAHLNEPENMVGIITDFLNKYDTGNRDLGEIQIGLIRNEEIKEIKL